MRQALPATSERRVCRLLGVSRWRPRPAGPGERRAKVVDKHLAELIRLLIARHATVGYRHLWALLRSEHGVVVAKKTVYRILKLKGWFVHQRPKTPRPRVHGLVSRRPARSEPTGRRSLQGYTLEKFRGDFGVEAARCPLLHTREIRKVREINAKRESEKPGESSYRQADPPTRNGSKLLRN